MICRLKQCASARVPHAQLQRRPVSKGVPKRHSWRQITRASDDVAAGGMSPDDAYQLLGVNPNTSFDDVLSAKKKKAAESGTNKDQLTKIEAAYDVILMQSMKRRLSGEISVASSVRYADVPIKKKTVPQKAAAAAAAPKTILPNLPGGSITVAAPKQHVAVTQSAVLGALAVWALIQALAESPEAAAVDVAGLQLALAVGFTIYSFKENKKVPIGKAAGLAVGCLVAGVMLGSLAENWIRVDIVPIGSFSSPGVLVAEVAMLALWAGCTFLA